MATGTTLDLITAALKRLGVLSGIETPTADLAQDALARLNELVESWSTESLTLWTQRVIRAGPLPGKPFYLIGPGAEIDVAARPAWIENITWLIPGNPEIAYPLQPWLKKEWELEPAKALTSSMATRYYYSADWPIGQLQLWPIPQQSFMLMLYLPQVVNVPALLTTVLVVPPGYWRALRDSLALELAPELGVPVNPALVQSAVDAKAQLQRVNFRPRTLSLPAEIATGDFAGYDWRTD